MSSDLLKEENIVFTIKEYLLAVISTIVEVIDLFCFEFHSLGAHFEVPLETGRKV